jgi:uncharacterized damage-inducible protein DinB
MTDALVETWQINDRINRFMLNALSPESLSGVSLYTPPGRTVGYLCAHEGYHRGEIGVILHQAGDKLDQKTAFGLWEWGVR